MLTEIEIERIRYDASRKVGGEFEDPDVFLLLDEVGRLREENKELKEAIKRMKENTHTCPDCGFEFHHYGEKSCPECENDRKNATIKELQEKSQRWEKAFTNADKQYLKKEKEVARLRRKIGESIPFIKSLPVDVLNESPSYLHNAVTLILHRIDAALGEGDKE